MNGVILQLTNKEQHSLLHRTSYGRMWEANRNREGSPPDSD